MEFDDIVNPKGEPFGVSTPGSKTMPSPTLVTNIENLRDGIEQWARDVKTAAGLILDCGTGISEAFALDLCLDQLFKVLFHGNQGIAELGSHLYQLIQLRKAEGSQLN